MHGMTKKSNKKRMVGSCATLQLHFLSQCCCRQRCAQQMLCGQKSLGRCGQRTKISCPQHASFVLPHWWKIIASNWNWSAMQFAAVNKKRVWKKRYCRIRRSLKKNSKSFGIHLEILTCECKVYHNNDEHLDNLFFFSPLLPSVKMAFGNPGQCT